MLSYTKISFYIHHFTKPSDDIQEERKTDLIVIELGLANELIEFHNEHEKEYKAFDKSDGLTKREIKMLLKKRR